MQIADVDRGFSIGHVRNALGCFDRLRAETGSVVSFIDSTKSLIFRG